jgi:glycerol-3-phosphate dehydrogenase
VRPWNDGRYWMFGTTDTPWDLGLDHPAVTSADVDYLLRNVNRVIDPPLRREDVVGAFAGLRPLVAGASDKTSRLSREHAVASPVPGLTAVAGGKYTTYRVMARDVIDAVLGPAGAKARPSDTAERRLVGAAEPGQLARIADELATIPALAAIGPEAARRLVDRHGTEAPAVVALGAELGLLNPLVPGRPFLEAEVAWAARHELAASLDDVLARRTRLAQELPDRGAAIARRAAAILGADLDWGDARQAFEGDVYLASARREFSVAPTGTSETNVATAVAAPAG